MLQFTPIDVSSANWMGFDCRSKCTARHVHFLFLPVPLPREKHTSLANNQTPFDDWHKIEKTGGRRGTLTVTELFCLWINLLNDPKYVNPPKNMVRSGNHWSPHHTKLPRHLSHIQHLYDIATGSILQYNSCFSHQLKLRNRKWALSTTQWTDKSSDFTSLVQKGSNLFPNSHRQKLKWSISTLNQHNTVIISHIDLTQISLKQFPPLKY